ncbi:MAG: DUF2058 domain-containing protein [Methylococcaceae bacterium]|nr:DUF2058 domain-containing protein [Methylococcaceae bacterium]
MAKLTLQEQLLKSGLVSNAQAKTIKSDKNKQMQQQHKNKVAVVDEAKLLVQQAQELKLLKDRELNQLRKEGLDQKGLAAQIKQLIELNVIAQDKDGIAYHFNDAGKVKTLYVSERVRDQLSSGVVAIVKMEKRYEIVSAAIVSKIRERDPHYFIIVNEVSAVIAADDPYAGYAIPDDLMW